MASSNVIQLSSAHKPVFYSPKMNDSSAQKASELLQENHQTHHIFFNKQRFHNHIVHHLLTIYALGANPDALQKAYDGNANYQLPKIPVKSDLVQGLHDPKKYSECLGKQELFSDFLAFFASEIEAKGLKETLNTYLFADTDQANDLFSRLFAGLLHPIIQLGFGLEFDQPALVAEALAETAIHENNVGPLFVAAEKAAKEYSGPDRTLSEITKEMFESKDLRSLIKQEDDNKTRDGIMKRGMETAAKLVGQWKVRPEQLEEKTAEMINNVCKSWSNLV
jgi:hypothetical protein